MPEFIVLGIDLAGVPHRPTGMCLLSEMEARTMLVYTDEDIMRAICREKPKLVTVDAPLELPPGRKSIAPSSVWSTF